MKKIKNCINLISICIDNVIYVYFYFLSPYKYGLVSRPPVPRFRKPEKYLCSRALKRPSSLRRSATAPSGVADLQGHQDIFHDASAFVKRGLTIKRLRSAEFFPAVRFIFIFLDNSMYSVLTDTAFITSHQNQSWSP